MIKHFSRIGDGGGEYLCVFVDCFHKDHTSSWGPGSGLTLGRELTGCPSSPYLGSVAQSSSAFAQDLLLDSLLVLSGDATCSSRHTAHITSSGCVCVCVVTPRGDGHCEHVLINLEG